MSYRLVLLLAVVVFMGCNSSKQVAAPLPEASEQTPPEQTSPQIAAGESTLTAENENAEQPDIAPITLVVADAQQYAEVIRKHKGKIVLVDFWATWCTPCVKQFPHTVELSKKYAGEVAVVSVSLDVPETDQARVLKFLKNRGAAFDNLISALGAGEASAEAFDIESGVPHYKIYDREGQLFAAFSADPDSPPLPEMIDLKLHELLGEK